MGCVVGEGQGGKLEVAVPTRLEALRTLGAVIRKEGERDRTIAEAAQNLLWVDCVKKVPDVKCVCLGETVTGRWRVEKVEGLVMFVEVGG